MAQHLKSVQLKKKHPPNQPTKKMLQNYHIVTRLGENINQEQASAVLHEFRISVIILRTTGCTCFQNNRVYITVTKYTTYPAGCLL